MGLVAWDWRSRDVTDECDDEVLLGLDGSWITLFPGPAY
jgi:hypothetical protein